MPYAWPYECTTGHSVVKTLLSVCNSQASQYRVPYTGNPAIARTPARQLVSSPANKPLKSSLKRSSWPLTHREDDCSVSRKKVRFKDRDGHGQLVSVCFFHATERPYSIWGTHPDNNNESSDDEGDYDTTLLRRSDVAAANMDLLPFDIAEIVSPIPSQRPTNWNIRLESLTTLLPAPLGQGQQQQPTTVLLRGLISVRNIAYEKVVAARYTYDGWSTTYEAHARYVDRSPAPKPARDSGILGPQTHAPAPYDSHGNERWDRFAFTISLGLLAPAGAPPRTLLLAVRFTVPGPYRDEWWDNNGDENFRVVLMQSASGPPGLKLPRQPPLAATHSANEQAAMCRRW